MPSIVWNADADAKLFCAVLAQLQGANLKLDYGALAKYMGPDCVVGAVKNRMARLKASVKADGPSTPSAKDASPPVSAPSSASPSVKRKQTPGPRKPRAKKLKNGQGHENSPKVERNPVGEEGKGSLLIKDDEEGKADAVVKAEPDESEEDPFMDI